MPAKIKKVSPYSGYKHPHKPRGVSKNAFQKVYWPYLPILFLIGSLTAFAFDSYAFKQPPGGLFGNVVMSDTKLTAETNRQRHNYKLPQLTFDRELDKAAQAKADDMVTRGYFSHVTPDGKEPWVFIDNYQYSYSKIGENLAAGFINEKTSVAGWMASKAHRQNMLDPLYLQVGFGVAYSENFTAAGGGPMAVVVAYYGSPPGSSVAKTLGVSTQKVNTTHAQLALGRFQLANIASVVTFCLLVGSLMYWAYRHALAIHKVVAKGESYIIRYPLVDIGLLVIAALAYILSRSAGIVR